MNAYWLRAGGKGVALLWAAWWIFFVVASELAEPVSAGQKALVCLIGISIFAGCAALAWLPSPYGGIVMLAEGIVLGTLYLTKMQNANLASQVFVLATLALPPLVSGILLLAAHRPHPHSTEAQFP
jgi:hypothetical protein